MSPREPHARLEPGFEPLFDNFRRRCTPQQRVRIRRLRWQALLGVAAGVKRRVLRRAS